jgi:hypothetical protein
MLMKFSLKTLVPFFALTLLVFATSCNHKDNKIKQTCFDEILNQEEQRVDCGGPNCPPCPPTCDDGVQNQDETAPDCGGPNCPPCGTCDDGIQNSVWVPSLQAFFAEAGIDCGFPCTNYCPPTCSDGIQNGDETGIDCGGAVCPLCPPPTCNDGVWNGLETGVDCGGPLCLPCPIATCNDGIQNQGETGIDCGGPCLNDCPVPTCFDGVQNQSETGIDCGGPCPTICPPPSCNDGILNNGEEWIDCGPTCFNICPNCTDGIENGPETGPDCLWSPIPEYSGGLCELCPSCFDFTINQEEIGMDCGGPYCPPCVNYLNVGTLNTQYFVGTNITVSVLGNDITITASETIGNQTRSLTLKLPMLQGQGAVIPIAATPITPSAIYDQNGVIFNTILLGSGNVTYDLHATAQLPGQRRIEGTINVIALANGLPPLQTTVYANNVTFGINY